MFLYMLSVQQLPEDYQDTSKHDTFMTYCVWKRNFNKNTLVDFIVWIIRSVFDSWYKKYEI
jgi:hypothetical protein